MPFTYDKQQRAFAGAVTNVIRDLEQQAPADDSRAEGQELWKRLVGIDLTALLIPEQHDGLGLSPIEMVAVVEAAGRSRIATPLAMTVGAFTPLIAGAASFDSDAEELLNSLLDGATGTLVPAFTCPILPDSAVSAVLHGTRLTVPDVVVPDAGADYVAVPAVRRDSDQHVLVVATSDQLGLTVHDGIGQALPLGRLDIADRQINGAMVFAYDARPVLPLAWVAAAAELTGLASTLIDHSVRYARERVQFGQAIGHFQAVKHQLVNAHLSVERARSLTMYAALVFDDSRSDVVRAAHHAKAAASEAASEAARTAVQVHGAAGITAANPISGMYLRAREKSMLLGGPDKHYGCDCLTAAA